MISTLKKISLTAILFFFGTVAMACPVCDRAQPKLLQGITHGGGPNGTIDYVIIAVMTILVLFTLFYSIKFLVKPGEKSIEHIKRTVLFND